MGEFIELVRKRRSIRSYRSEPVPREKIELCIEAARFAPTACNTQSWRFIVVEGELKVRLVKEALGGVIVPNRFALQAPVIVVIAVDMNLVTHRLGGGLKGIDYHMIDTGIAGEHFVLQAAELDLGTCWIGWFNKKAVKRLLGLSRGWEVTAMITLGYPASVPPDKKRKSVSDVSDFKR
ncbi:MAG: nitroreductase family protein [bacterium]|nr:MAG: nitroreductase family protein [bacterium]